MGAAVLIPSLLSLLLVVAAAGAAARAEDDAMIRPAASAAGNNKVLGETLCCTNMTLFHECVKACFDFYPLEEAKKYCDPGCKEAYQCHTVSGDKCPTTSRHRSTSDDSSEKGNDAAVGHCILGCNSSVCNKMVAGVGRKGVMKHAVESCNSACYKFCTKDVRAGISTA